MYWSYHPPHVPAWPLRLFCSSVAATLLIAAPTASAQSSDDFARMGAAAHTAFECAVLASRLDQPLPQARLFLHGYTQGKAFIGALQTSRIEQADINRHVPLNFISVLQGPSVDFMLGRLYEFVQENTLAKVLGPANARHDAQRQRTIAHDLYSRASCAGIALP